MDVSGDVPKPSSEDLGNVESAQESGETVENSKDQLRASFALANLAFEVASKHFKDQGEIGSDRYDHLGTVVDLGHVLPLGDKMMTDSLQTLGYDLDHAKVIPAIYMGERGGIKVDAVALREAADVEPLIMLHEFVHRAAEQRGLQGEAIPFHEQMYQLLDFPKETMEEMKKSSPEEYKTKLSETKEIIRCFNEGITQWATLYLANKTPEFNPPVTTEVYKDESGAVRKWFVSALGRRGFSEDQIDGLMLDLALTGDFSQLEAALPLGEDLKQRGFRSDFYVSNLILGVHSSSLLSKYDRVLGQESTEGI